MPSPGELLDLELEGVRVVLLVAVVAVAFGLVVEVDGATWVMDDATTLVVLDATMTAISGSGCMLQFL